MKFNLKKTIAGISALALAATQITVMVANAAGTASAKQVTLDSVTKFEKAGVKLDGDTAYATWNKEAYKLLQSATEFNSEISTSYGTFNVAIDGPSREIVIEGDVDLSKQFAAKFVNQIKNKLDGYTISDSDVDVKGSVEVVLTYDGLENGYSLGVDTAEYKDGDTTINFKSVDVDVLKKYSNSKLAEIKENIKADLKAQIAADYNDEVAANAKFNELEAVVDDYATKAENKISKLDKTVSIENAATADEAVAELAKKAGAQSIDSVDSFFSKNAIANLITNALEKISQEAGKASKGKYEVAVSQDDIKSFAKTGTNVSATYSTSAASTSFNFVDGEKSFELDGKTYEIVDGKKLFEAKYTGSEVEIKVSAKVKEKVEETTETTPAVTSTTPKVTTVVTTSTTPEVTTVVTTSTTPVTTVSTTTVTSTTPVTTVSTTTVTSTTPKVTTTATTSATTSVSAVDSIKDAKVVYTDSKANANFYFSTEKAYTFVVKATVNGKETELDAKNISYSIGGKKVTSPADTFQKGTHKYDLDVLYNGKSLGVKATAYIGVRGDANLDDTVNQKDAVKVLQFYADSMAYSKDHKTAPVLYSDKDAGLESLAKFLGNPNLSKDGSIDQKDGVVILQYYAAVLVNQKNHSIKVPEWEELYKAD